MSWGFTSTRLNARWCCVSTKSRRFRRLIAPHRCCHLRPGLPAQVTHDYQRHGTTSLFAALDVASGKVHDRCYRRHRHQEFIGFLNSLARTYPGRELHLICNNYGTHNHQVVREWLAAHPRCHLHFTPTSAS